MKAPMQIMAEAKEQNRLTIKRSMIFTSGAGFDTNDAARVLRSTRAAAAHILEGMVDDCILDKSLANNKKITYKAKGVDWLCRSWRPTSNEKLGIKSTRLGSY